MRIPLWTESLFATAVAIMRHYSNTNDFSPKNVLWLPVELSITRTVDLLVLFKLHTLVFAGCKERILFLQLLTFTAVDLNWGARELFRFSSGNAVWLNHENSCSSQNCLNQNLNFCYVLSMGRCNVFQHIFKNQIKSEFYEPYFQTMLFLVTMFEIIPLY